jgi:hypothetical protein
MFADHRVFMGIPVAESIKSRSRLHPLGGDPWALTPKIRSIVPTLRT